MTLLDDLHIQIYCFSDLSHSLPMTVDTVFEEMHLSTKPVFHYLEIDTVFLTCSTNEYNTDRSYLDDKPEETESSSVPNGPTTGTGIAVELSDVPVTRLNKFRQLARCFFHINCRMNWSAGALVAMNAFSSYEQLSKQPYQKWQLRFCEDFVDFIYQTKEQSNPNYEYIKRLPANFIDKSVIITTSTDGFVLYIQMKGNVIDLTSKLIQTVDDNSFIRFILKMSEKFNTRYQRYCSSFRVRA
jgi:hypothetical protein